MKVKGGTRIIYCVPVHFQVPQDELSVAKKLSLP